MPFAGILEILEPFLRGAVWCPKEALFQKGSRIFNMATSYYSIAPDHLADHLIYLFSSSSFWFSLNSSYEHDFHLLLELMSSEPLTLDKEVCMQKEWHRGDERKCIHLTCAQSPPPWSRYRWQWPAFCHRRIIVAHSIAVHHRHHHRIAVPPSTTVAVVPSNAVAVAVAIAVALAVAIAVAIVQSIAVIAIALPLLHVSQLLSRCQSLLRCRIAVAPSIFVCAISSALSPIFLYGGSSYAWLRKSPTCRRHVAPTAKCRHFWPKCPCRADTILIPPHFFLSGFADIHQNFLFSTRGTYGEFLCKFWYVGYGWGSREILLVSDNAKKIRLSHDEK